jgi:hypothetical protein
MPIDGTGKKERSCGWHKVRLVNGEHSGEIVFLLDQWTVYSK